MLGPASCIQLVTPWTEVKGSAATVGNDLHPVCAKGYDVLYIVFVYRIQVPAVGVL